VGRCTQIICDTLAGLPWSIVRGDYERLPVPDWITDPQALRVDQRVVDPRALYDARLSAFEFWANWVCSALWWGDGYVYVPVRDAAGQPVPPIWGLHPHDVTIDGGAYFVGGQQLPAGSVLHLRGFLPYNTLHGRGVLTAYGPTLGLAASVQRYAAGTFTTGVPAGYLQSTQPSMTQDQADRLKATWMAQHGGERRTIAVLNATTSFHPVAISPVDAQLGGAREWSNRDIAVAFGVPPYMLGVPGDSSTYANVESRMIELSRFTFLPWAWRIEAELSAQLPRGTNLHVRLEGLQRADTATRYKAYSEALQAGWMTVNEVRELEDMAPFEGEAVA